MIIGYLPVNKQEVSNFSKASLKNLFQVDDYHVYYKGQNNKKCKYNPPKYYMKAIKIKVFEPIARSIIRNKHKYSSIGSWYRHLFLYAEDQEEIYWQEESDYFDIKNNSLLEE